MFSKFPGHTDLLRGSGHTDLLSGPVPATLLSFSWPFMLSTLLQTLYTTADTVIVGQYLGKTYMESKHRPIYIASETDESYRAKKQNGKD